MRRYVGWGCLWVSLVVVILFFVHPYLLGLPGRVHELKFEHQLHRGLSRAEVLRLSEQTGGQRGFPGNVVSDFERARAETKSGVELFWFMDQGTVCITSGNLYHLHFDRTNRLMGWTTSRWSDTC